MLSLRRSLPHLLGLGPRRHRNVFEQIVAPANMAAALARVQRRARENVTEGKELRTYSDEAGRRLEALRQDLIRGRYAPQRTRKVVLPKAGGGQRRLKLLAVPDRIAQTATNQVLTPLLDVEFADASFGYRPNRSLADALERVQAHRRAGLAWVVEADILKCFETVRHDRLIERLRDSIADRRAIRLVNLWLAAFGHDQQGLPQGAPLSPLLCNLALDPIDQALAAGPGELVRFADDLVILCHSRGEAKAAQRRAAGVLKRQGLQFNTDKTRIRSFYAGFSFLNHCFVEDLMLRDAARDAVPEVKRRAERRQRSRSTGWFGRRTAGR